jgi:hypothetical protein
LPSPAWSVSRRRIGELGNPELRAVARDRLDRPSRRQDLSSSRWRTASPSVTCRWMIRPRG